MIPNAYLKAKLTNKSKFLFLQGPSNIFVDNNFMTKVLRLCYHSSSSVIHWVTQVFDIWWMSIWCFAVLSSNSQPWRAVWCLSGNRLCFEDWVSTSSSTARDVWWVQPLSGFFVLHFLMLKCLYASILFSLHLLHFNTTWSPPLFSRLLFFKSVFFTSADLTSVSSMSPHPQLSSCLLLFFSRLPL